MDDPLPEDVYRDLKTARANRPQIDRNRKTQRMRVYIATRELDDKTLYVWGYSPGDARGKVAEAMGVRADLAPGEKKRKSDVATDFYHSLSPEQRKIFRELMKQEDEDTE